MKIKPGKEVDSLAVFLTLLVAMQLEINRMILLFTICLIVFILSNIIHGEDKVDVLEKTKRYCRYELLILGFFLFIQVISLEKFGIREIVLDIEILACVYIGIICGAISIKQCRSFESFLKGILMFLILFSVYYIAEIVIHGLPEGRGSALGNVSSNYCSAILYLNYPAILYYLFGRDQNSKNNKRLDLICYVAIALSLVVIVSSGSRTSIAVVALMIMQMVLYKQKKIENKIKVVCIIIIAAIGVLMAYSFNPSVHNLMERALAVFSGKKTLTDNIRILVWDAGLQQFGKGNVMLGLGTNIVEKFNICAHNLVFEVLMCSGYIGLFVFFLLVIPLIVFLFKKQKYHQRFFFVMLMFASLITASFQPFFSSSYTCGLMVWMATFALAADAERRMI